MLFPEVVHNEQIDRFVRFEYLVLGGVAVVESLLDVGQQVAGRLADDRDAASYELQGDGGREVRFAGSVCSLYVEALATLCALWKAVCIGFGRVVAPPPLRGVPDEVGERPLLEAFLDAAPAEQPLDFGAPFGLRRLFLGLRLLSGLLCVRLRPFGFCLFTGASLRERGKHEDRSAHHEGLVVQFPAAELALDRLRDFALAVVTTSQNILACRPSVLCGLSRTSRIRRTE